MNLTKYSKLNYGCGFDKRDGYLNVDMDPACNPDFLIKGTDLSQLPKHHFEEVLAKDVLEHIPRNGTMSALLEFSSLLRANGTLILQTSDVIRIIKQMEENNTFANHYGWTVCLFGSQMHPGDFHYTGFTEITLRVHLEAAGFEIIKSEIIEKWCPKLECRKVFSWDHSLDEDNSDVKFLENSYQEIFSRPLDDTGRVHFGGLLKRKEKTRREILKEIYSAPERLYVTSRKLGL